MRNWSIQLDAALLDSIVERVAARPGKVQLLRGPSGIGKTTLASAVTRRLVDDGRVLLPVIGVRELASIPLAAMAPLLALGDNDPAMSTADRVQRLFGVVAARRDNYVLAVDDAPLLDEVSASTVYQLVRIYGLRCIMTARSSDPIDGPLQRLLDDELVEITELDGLSREQAVAAVEGFFAATVEPASLKRILHLAGGNPLFLREIVFGAEPRGDTSRAGDAISIDQAHIPPRIADAVRRRFEELSSDEQQLIELLAVAEPLPAERLGDPRLVRRLVEQQVIEVKVDQAYLAHPTFAEVIEASLSEKEVRARRAQAAALIGPPERDDERFKIVTLLEGGPHPPTVDDLVWASSYAGALDDQVLALHLADAALAAGGGFAAQIARGRSLAWLLRFDEADASYAAAVPLPRNDEERAMLASSRALAAYGRRDFLGAADVLSEALGSIEDPDVRSRIEVEIGKWRLISGRSAAAIDRLFTSEDPAIALNAAVVEAARGVFAGDIPGMRAAIAHGRRFDGRVVVDMAHGRQLFDLTEVFLAMFEGDPEGGRRLARERAESHLEADAGLGWFALGLLDLYTGRIGAARRSSGTAIEILGRVDVGGLLGPAIALRAAADAQLGDRAAAERQLAKLTGVMRQHVSAAALAAEAEAWLIAGVDDADAATRHVATAVAEFAAAGLFGLAVPLARVAILLGRPEAVAEAIRTAAIESPGPYFTATADLVTALDSQSAEGALSAAAALARIGQDATALAGAVAARRLFRGADVVDGRRRAELLANSLLERVSMPRSGRREATELSDREWAVARAAAGRERSREIADRLGLSVRTVDNHLRNIYRKLGVSSRDELGRELGLESIP